MTITQTEIFRFRSSGEERIGYLTDGTIYRVRWQEGIAVGRYDQTGRIFRNTSQDERELGTISPDGTIRSHGLFEGGDLGWLDEDGVVTQGGLIFEEEEIGRVEGPERACGAAALLLLFLPDEDEANRHMKRSS